MDARAASATIATLMREPSFREAMEFIANAEADRHLGEMRRCVKDGKPEHAAVSEAVASEWERILVVFDKHARKFEHGE